MGSLVAALASFLDARRHGGEWLVRIEDVDTIRARRVYESEILRELERHGLFWDGSVVRQSERTEFYIQALAQLEVEHLLYPCFCSRQNLKSRGCKENAQGELIYPGFCRPEASVLAFGRPASNNAACRFLIRNDDYEFVDLLAGAQSGHVLQEAGDLVLRRADGCFTYHLAVVVDDFLQGVTRVVRGSDILPLTGRHILLQRALGYPTPVYAHIPLVLEKSGEKLSKSTSARALAETSPLENLTQALARLGVKINIRDFSRPDEVLTYALGQYALT